MYKEHVPVAIHDMASQLHTVLRRCKAFITSLPLYHHMLCELKQVCT